MNLGRHPQRLLVIAFVLSLLLHLIFAVVMRQSRGSTPNGVEVVTIEHRSAIVRMQTPPPRPKVTPVPHPRPSARPAPHKTHGARPQSSANGTAVAASAAPTPEPTPAVLASAAACAKSDIGAAVVGDPPQPDVPNAARAEGTSGVATITVRLDARGEVTGADVARGTGNSSLDLVALGMARAARYAPATRDCKPIAAQYAFSVKFFAW
jgi:TonB family protein